MNDFIKIDMSRKIAQALPSVQSRYRTLKNFALFSGREIVSKAPGYIAERVDQTSYYLVMSFDGNGTREEAKAAFKMMMEDKLHMQSSEGSIDQELLPRSDAEIDRYNGAPVAPPSQQLGYDPSASVASTKSNDDVIDLDPETGAVRDPGTAVMAKQNFETAKLRDRYYMVEFKVEEPPQLRGRADPRMLGRRGPERYLRENDAKSVFVFTVWFDNKIKNFIYSSPTLEDAVELFDFDTMSGKKKFDVEIVSHYHDGTADDVTDEALDLIFKQGE